MDRVVASIREYSPRVALAVYERTRNVEHWYRIFEEESFDGMLDAFGAFIRSERDKQIDQSLIGVLATTEESSVVFYILLRHSLQNLFANIESVISSGDYETVLCVPRLVIKYSGFSPRFYTQDVAPAFFMLYRILRHLYKAVKKMESPDSALAVEFLTVNNQLTLIFLRNNLIHENQTLLSQCQVMMKYQMKLPHLLDWVVKDYPKYLECVKPLLEQERMDEEFFRSIFRFLSYPDIPDYYLVPGYLQELGDIIRSIFQSSSFQEHFYSSESGDVGVPPTEMYKFFECYIAGSILWDGAAQRSDVVSDFLASVTFPLFAEVIPRWLESANIPLMVFKHIEMAFDPNARSSPAPLFQRTSTLLREHSEKFYAQYMDFVFVLLPELLQFGQELCSAQFYDFVNIEYILTNKGIAKAMLKRVLDATALGKLDTMQGYGFALSWILNSKDGESLVKMLDEEGYLRVIVSKLIITFGEQRESAEYTLQLLSQLVCRSPTISLRFFECQKLGAFPAALSFMVSGFADKELPLFIKTYLECTADDYRLLNPRFLWKDRRVHRVVVSNSGVVQKLVQMALGWFKSFREPNLSSWVIVEHFVFLFHGPRTLCERLDEAGFYSDMLRFLKDPPLSFLYLNTFPDLLCRDGEILRNLPFFMACVENPGEIPPETYLSFLRIMNSKILTVLRNSSKSFKKKFLQAVVNKIGQYSNNREIVAELKSLMRYIVSDSAEPQDVLNLVLIFKEKITNSGELESNVGFIHHLLDVFITAIQSSWADVFKPKHYFNFSKKTSKIEIRDLHLVLKNGLTFLNIFKLERPVNSRPIPLLSCKMKSRLLEVSIVKKNARNSVSVQVFDLKRRTVLLARSGEIDQPISKTWICLCMSLRANFQDAVLSVNQQEVRLVDDGAAARYIAPSYDEPEDLVVLGKSLIGEKRTFFGDMGRALISNSPVKVTPSIVRRWILSNIDFFDLENTDRWVEHMYVSWECSVDINPRVLCNSKYTTTFDVRFSKHRLINNPKVVKLSKQKPVLLIENVRYRTNKSIMDTTDILGGSLIFYPIFEITEYQKDAGTFKQLVKVILLLIGYKTVRRETIHLLDEQIHSLAFYIHRNHQIVDEALIESLFNFLNRISYTETSIKENRHVIDLTLKYLVLDILMMENISDAVVLSTARKLLDFLGKLTKESLSALKSLRVKQFLFVIEKSLAGEGVKSEARCNKLFECLYLLVEKSSKSTSYKVGIICKNILASFHRGRSKSVKAHLRFLRDLLAAQKHSHIHSIHLPEFFILLSSQDKEVRLLTLEILLPEYQKTPEATEVISEPPPNIGQLSELLSLLFIGTENPFLDALVSDISLTPSVSMRLDYLKPWLFFKIVASILTRAQCTDAVATYLFGRLPPLNGDAIPNRYDVYLFISVLDAELLEKWKPVLRLVLQDGRNLSEYLQYEESLVQLVDKSVRFRDANPEMSAVMTEYTKVSIKHLLTRDYPFLECMLKLCNYYRDDEDRLQFLLVQTLYSMRECLESADETVLSNIGSSIGFIYLLLADRSLIFGIFLDKLALYPNVIDALIPILQEVDISLAHPPSSGIIGSIYSRHVMDMLSSESPSMEKISIYIDILGRFIDSDSAVRDNFTLLLADLLTKENVNLRIVKWFLERLDGVYNPLQLYKLSPLASDALKSPSFWKKPKFDLRIIYGALRTGDPSDIRSQAEEDTARLFYLVQAILRDRSISLIFPRTPERIYTKVLSYFERDEPGVRELEEEKEFFFREVKFWEVRNEKAYSKVLKFNHNPGMIWYDEEIARTHYLFKLDEREDLFRRRLKTKFIRKPKVVNRFQTKVRNVQRRKTILSDIAYVDESNHIDLEFNTENSHEDLQEQTSDYAETTRESSPHVERPGIRQSEMNAKIPERYNVFSSKYGAKRITSTGEVDGTMLLTRKEIVFYSDKTIKKWNYDTVSFVLPRTHLFLETALEIFFKNNKVRFFVFDTPRKRKKFIKELGKSARLKKNHRYSNLSKVRRDWVNGAISNFEYLMCLNTIAGRTYNSLAQYPVFPWVYNYYRQTYRDLSKPVGALNEEKFRVHYAKYNHLVKAFRGDPDDVKPFMYGSHYSNEAIIIFFMMRVYPFTAAALNLQGGKFDKSDRMFWAIEETSRSVLEMNMDFRELIPSLYYFPEMYFNENGFTLGSRQNGEVVEDVDLGRSYKNIWDFLEKNLEYLESREVSAHLNEWIDLIFGCDQRGRRAVRKGNVFYHLTYPGSVDVTKIDDPKKRAQVIDQLMFFGQVPKQLFTRKKHPRRKYMRRTEVEVGGGPEPLIMKIGEFELVSYRLESTMEFGGKRAFEFMIVEENSWGVRYLYIDLNSSEMTEEKSSIYLNFENRRKQRRKFLFVGDKNRYLFANGFRDGSLKVVDIYTNYIKNVVVHHSKISEFLIKDGLLVTCSEVILVQEMEHVEEYISDPPVLVLQNDADPAHPLMSENLWVPKEETTPVLSLLLGHTSQVTCIDIDRGLDLVISSSRNGKVLLHNLESGILHRELLPDSPAGESEVVFVSFVNDMGYSCIVTNSSKGCKVLTYSINGKHSDTYAVTHKSGARQSQALVRAQMVHGTLLLVFERRILVIKFGTTGIMSVLYSKYLSLDVSSVYMSDVTGTLSLYSRASGTLVVLEQFLREREVVLSVQERREME